MAWLSLVTGGIKLLSLIMQWAERNRLLDAGQKEQLARDLTEVIDAGNLAAQVRAEMDAKTDAELDEELQK